jgi:YihY family inner membrane protein
MEPTSPTSPTDAAPLPEAITTTWLLRPLVNMFRQRGWSTLRYLTQTDVHTFAFSVAANAILSFFPFIVLIMWLVRNVLHSPNMTNVIAALLRDHLPAGQDFVIRNLNIIVNARRQVRIASVVILLITSSGVFLPLEVAFNRAWGFARNRSYFRNQLVSFALALSCGLLALLFTALAASNEYILGFIFPSDSIFFKVASFIILRLFAIATSISIFFLVYWLLPNGKVSARSVLPAAVAMGVLWEVAQFLYVRSLQWLNFQEVYGPFWLSTTLMFWAFISGMMVLAGAHLAANHSPKQEPIGTAVPPIPTAESNATNS